MSTNEARLPLGQPQRFGRYILIDRLGKGGMAEVFRAVMPGVEGFRRDLVIKQIRPDQAHARNFIEMFAHEARISALLHHPNIVQVFDFGQVDGCYFLAMELLRGRDLLAIMKALRDQRRAFPIPIAAHVAQQVALGLAYAHGMHTPAGEPLNILHRDVSPSNIMCLKTGGVKLLDFGIASALGELDSSAGDESTFTFKGKLSYMAPERLRPVAPSTPDSPPRELDGRIDLFSLGTVLWELLAGKRLFHGKTEEEKLRALLDKPITPPSALRANVPARLDAIVLKALERDPDRRYLTGQALADDLEEIATETKYQSRMLPSLLAELFGEGASKSHIAISNLSADLLFVEPTFSVSSAPPPVFVERVTPTSARPPANAPEGSASSGSFYANDEMVTPGAEAALRRDEEPRGHRRKIAVAMAMGLGLVVLAVVAVLAIVSRPHRLVATAGVEFAPSPSTNAGSTPAAHASAQSAPTPLSQPPRAPEPTSSAGHARPVARSSKSDQAATHRPGTATPRSPSSKSSSGRLVKGLSIDPFAEAAARHGARPP